MANTGRSSSSGVAHQGAAGAAKRDPKDIGRLVAVVVILAYLVAFIVENSQTVEVHFVFWSAHVSLIWALLIAAVLGIALERLVIYVRRRRQKTAEPQS
jgi:uncharacterized integral membrane protein